MTDAYRRTKRHKWHLVGLDWVQSGQAACLAPMRNPGSAATIPFARLVQEFPQTVCTRCARLSKALLRYVPDHMIGRDKRDGAFRDQRIVRIEAIPPSARTAGDAPIVPHLTLVKMHLESGSVRYQGTEHAFIDASLRMVIQINPRDEVLHAWERVQ